MRRRWPWSSLVLVVLGSLHAGAAAEPTGWLVDETLRHIGNNRYQTQCGFEQLQRVGVWGAHYSLPFRMRAKGRVTVVIEAVWGVNAPAAMRLDDRRIGEIPANAELDHPRCGSSWRSSPVDLAPGMHRLTLSGYQWRDDIDDIAFRGIRIITDPPNLLLGYGPAAVDRVPRSLAPTNWMEVLMDTTTLLATFGLLAFMVERLTHGMTLVLSYSSWWRSRIEPGEHADPAARAAIERNRRVIAFSIGAVLAVLGALWLKLDLLLKFGVPIGAAADSVAGPIVTGLLIAAGADPIRDLLQGREQRTSRSDSSAPIQVTGTLVVQQTLPADSPR